MTTPYNYPKYTSQVGSPDSFAGAKVGEIIEDFQFTKLNGDPVRLSAFADKTLVIETGSITCPIYSGKVKKMNRLAQKYPDMLFIVMYVREAHPGGHIAEHHNLDDKLECARRVVDAEGESRLILIDDIDGTAHAAMGDGLPNALYILDGERRVVLRGRWNNTNMLDKVLLRLQNDESLDGLEFAFQPFTPFDLLRVFRRAGWRSLWDFALAIPGLVGWHWKEARTTFEY